MAPWATTQVIVGIQQIPGTSTSIPGPMSSALIAANNPPVPLLTEAAHLAEKN